MIYDHTVQKLYREPSVAFLFLFSENVKQQMPGLQFLRLFETVTDGHTDSSHRKEQSL